MQEHLRRFRSLGSDCLVRVVTEDGDPSGARHIETAVARVAELEARWSRFRADSELSSINAHAGSPVYTSADTAELVALAVEAWRATGGRFDPTVLDALVASGYDRTFEEVAADPSGDTSGAAPAVPGAGGIEVDERVGLVHLPDGCHLDLGGIGKGRAADLVVEQLLGAGAAGVCLDLGGDVRVGGATTDGGDDWLVAVDDPAHTVRDLAVLRLADGAVATSSRAKRRWTGPAGPAHHLIDPTTGRPAESDLLAVTVVGASAAWGEVHAKAALIAGSVAGRALVDGSGMASLFVGRDGSLTTVGPIDDYLVGPPPR